MNPQKAKAPGITNLKGAQGPPHPPEATTDAVAQELSLSFERAGIWALKTELSHMG